MAGEPPRGLCRAPRPGRAAGAATTALVCARAAASGSRGADRALLGRNGRALAPPQPSPSRAAAPRGDRTPAARRLPAGARHARRRARSGRLSRTRVETRPGAPGGAGAAPDAAIRLPGAARAEALIWRESSTMQLGARCVETALILTLTAWIGPGAAAAQVPSPESSLGFEVGSDRKLADWNEITAYFNRLAQASDRVELDTLGTTTLGRPFILLTISSPENLR